MYTVIIAEQEHLDGIQEHDAFLKPFLQGKDIAFCAWNTEGQTMEEAVPDLAAAVARHLNWRAVIVCNEQGLKKRNPFNVVEYKAPEKPMDPAVKEFESGHSNPQFGEEEQILSKDEKQKLLESAIEQHRRNQQEMLGQFLESHRAEKQQAYEQAAKQPLTRLVTFLCESPVIADGRNLAHEDDVEYNEYRIESQYKEELRKRMLAGHSIQFSYPTEIICLAKRCCNEPQAQLSSTWNPHVELEYTKFYDWNLYYDKMRYLVFDILPKTHQDYAFNYIRFLYLILIVATYGPAEGALLPNRVYRAECDNDENALRRLVVSYDEKLKLTDEQIEREIAEISSKEKPRLTDRDVASIFCANVSVPVTIDSAYARGELFSDTKQFGLSRDCPREESAVWDSDYKRSRKSLHNFLKQPRRALKQATESLQALSVVDMDRVPQLNRFQLEDVQEYVSEAELKMAKMETSDYYDVSRFNETLEKDDKSVKDKIETRMSKRTTIVLGAIALAGFIIGFLPLFFSNLNNALTFGTAILFLALVIALMCGIAIVCLWFLRRALRKKVEAYNDSMRGIVSEVDRSLTDYSRYLSYAGNVMRGMSVLKFFRNHVDPEETKVRVRKKHQMDIRRLRAELSDTFGCYLTDRDVIEGEAIQTYPYNYDREVDFNYSLPYTDKTMMTIQYMKPGSQITLPVDFVRSITIRLEELYDK